MTSAPPTALAERPATRPRPSPPPATGVGPRPRRRRELTPHALGTAIHLGAVATVAWPIAEWLHGPAPRPLVPLVAHVSGMLAGYGVLVLLALMSRAPALERGIGADVLARWHARGGRLVLVSVLVHAWGAVAAWAALRGEAGAAALWQVLRMPGLAAATLGTALLAGVGIASARAARRRLSYERWHALHLLTYVAVALSSSHQLAGPDLAGHRLLQVGWALLYAYVFALVLRHRVLAPLRQAARHRLRVRRVVDEGPGVISIEVEGTHLDELDAEPGQFFRWRFLTPDHWGSAHPFSLSAPPTTDHLRLTVKALGRGSAHLQSVPVGTWVVAEGPYGAMTERRRTRRDVLLIAGGVGITPMRALVETLALEPGQDLLLVYRARTPEEVLFRDELDDIARRRGARIAYLYGDDPACLSAAELRRRVRGLEERDVFLCGPPGMTAAVRTALQEAGHPPDLLHDERFSW
ncbi:MAG TPA: ferredoxin reductase family protein [Aquihabitans sp.]|nr:ferredoxin reductase family protein [Aquihabitans sp.]